MIFLRKYKQLTCYTCHVIQHNMFNIELTLARTYFIVEEKKVSSK